MILRPRDLELSDQMRDAWSDGVPPKAGRPLDHRTRLRAWRASKPATDQLAGYVCLMAMSTLGVSVQLAARRSLPNHATTIATRSRFGHDSLQFVERGLDVGRRVRDMAVLGAELAGAERLHHGRRLVAELGRAGDQRDGAHHFFQPADRAHHLERELRNAVAEIGERQPLEHDIGEPAIGRRVALLARRSADPASALRRRCRCDRETGEVERLAVRPDAHHRADRPFAQADREDWQSRCRSVVLVVTVSPPPLPPPLSVRLRRRDHLFELGRPDHLAGEPRAAVDARDRRALGRGHHVEIGEARAFL